MYMLPAFNPACFCLTTQFVTEYPVIAITSGGQVKHLLMHLKFLLCKDLFHCIELWLHLYMYVYPHCPYRIPLHHKGVHEEGH